ncbi:MAG: hypothetical protein M3304_10960 [Actinomycetota bacterium]|nr:hypothetical protein [Actinomycetota bacterium]
MARAGWTYQVPPAGAPATGLEEYVVEAAAGARVGKVQTLLCREDELLLAVERGNPPLSHDVRAVPWSAVERVDHEALAVRLRLGEDAVAQALELDPEKGVEDGDADALRLTELPAELRPSSDPGRATGPVDRPTYAVAMALGAVGLVSFLAVVIALTAEDAPSWVPTLFLVPAILLVAAGAAAYRVFRAPYERR